MWPAVRGQAGRAKGIQQGTEALPRRCLEHARSALYSLANGLSNEKRIRPYKSGTKPKDRKSGCHKCPFVNLVLALLPRDKQTSECHNRRDDNLKPRNPSQAGLDVTITSDAIAQNVEKPHGFHICQDDDYVHDRLHAERKAHWPGVAAS